MQQFRKNKNEFFVASVPHFPYICLGAITQDVSEEVFGNLRSFLQLVSIIASACFMRFCCFFQRAIGLRYSNPDINAVSSRVTSIIQKKAIKRIKEGNTTVHLANEMRGKMSVMSLFLNPLKQRPKGCSNSSLFFLFLFGKSCTRPFQQIK